MKCIEKGFGITDTGFSETFWAREEFGSGCTLLEKRVSDISTIYSRY